MRPCEWLLAALTIAGSLALFVRKRPPALAWLFCTLAAILIAVHVLHEGPHWQLLYLYVAIALVAIRLFRPSPQPWTASIALTLTAGSLTLAWILPIFHLPAPTGPYAVGTRTLHLTDPSRQRELVAQLWYPAEATGPFAQYVRPAEIKPLFRYLGLVRTNSHQDATVATIASGPIPILLFGHMWGGRRTQDTFLAEDLASHGYFVVAIDHPGNSALVQLASGTVVRGTMATALQDHHTPDQITTLWNRELAVWTQDNRFVLDALLTSSTFSGHLDPTRIGAFGHSFGGAAALDLLGPVSNPQDPRIQSAVNLDGWTFGGLTTRTTQPILILYEAQPASRNPHPETLPSGTSTDDQLSLFDQSLVNLSVQHYGGDIAYIQGTQHLDFTDQTLVSPLQRLTYTGPIPGPRIRQITRTLVLSFFDQTLKNRNPSPTLPSFPELYWTSRYASVPQPANH